MPYSEYGNALEIEYSRNTSLEHRRALGQFFTPYKVARFMAEWILQNSKTDLAILDPAAGFGIFERALVHLNQTRKLSFELWEKDRAIAAQLKDTAKECGIAATILEKDFFTGSWDNTFDGIIANPPYFKHHFIENKEKIHGEVCLKTNFTFSLQTNIYCWFLLKAINLLDEGGRLAFIVPSEFLNANYGEHIKEYLKRTGVVLHLINIDFNENVFDNALTTSVIILAEKVGRNSDSINFYSLHDPAELISLRTFLTIHPKKSYTRRELNPAIKWRNYFNGNGEQKRSLALAPISLFGRFSRGIATGANEYFTLTSSEVADNRLSRSCLIPCITKASHAKDIYFGEKEYAGVKTSGKKVFLFNGEGADDRHCREYIQEGETSKVNQKYLTRNRNPWYALEKRSVAPIWISVFGRNGLKFVWNESPCVNLTCFHAFYPTKLGQTYLDIFFLYLHSSIAKELFDREKREYGNGLEKFEPNDLNKACMLDLQLLSSEDTFELADLQRSFLISGKQNRDEILRKADLIFNRVSRPTVGVVSYQA